MTGVEPVHRVAQVRLRGRRGSLRGRAYWPAPAGPAPALLVCFGGSDTMCRALCAWGRVVLAMPEDADLHDAMLAVEWAAEHAAELGTDPCRLLAAGTGAGAAMAVAVARQARQQGWPPVTAVSTERLLGT